ncbi:MAG TPA: ABC transporter permease [Bryobacterales bacterium]|jgi:putative ABC transport system permease protein|nr:ABC transporter permease [Bryobacterales bacterium]
MSVAAIVKIALRALGRNKMRTALTMLGIIIGVAAVIAIVGISQGANEQMQQAISDMGANLLFISPGSPNVGGVRAGGGAAATLRVSDMAAIERQVKLVRLISPGVFDSAMTVYQNRNWSTRVQGVAPSYFEIRMWPVSAGSPFGDAEVERAADVCVLGQTVVDNLFQGEDPVGKMIRVKNLPMTVMGVLAVKGPDPGGRDQDDTILMPYTTVQKKLRGIDYIHFIQASAISEQATAAAQTQIEGVLRERHRIRPGQPDDFTVRNMADFAEVANQAGSVMTMLLASVASVSLIVGGIGIMNIMLVSVTERTREIGIRMAIGATEQDVLRQFLIEAVILSMLGGLAGIVVGIASVIGMAQVLRWPTTVSITALLSSMLFSAGIGVFFGFYPARKAAQLDPIEALRFE